VLRNLGGHPGPATLQGRRRERFTRRHLFVRCVWKIGGSENPEQRLGVELYLKAGMDLA